MTESPPIHPFPESTSVDPGALRPQFDTERLARIAQWADGHVEAGRLPFCSVVLGDRDEVRFEHFSQPASPWRAAAHDADTLLRIYSMTKPVTGVALLMLLERGLFCLDDPVADYLPELGDLRVLVGGSFQGIDTAPAPDVTIRQVATHTAGFTYHFFPHDPVAAIYRKAGLTGGLPAPQHASLAEWTRCLGEQPLLFAPGARWNYSVGMDVLGRLIEVLTGDRLADVFEREIFAPLAMSDTAFWAPPQRVERLAPCFGRSERGQLEVVEAGGVSSPLAEFPSIDFGGGGLVSSAADYARFARMLLRGGELDGVRLLGRKTVELMASNHLPHELTPLAGHAPVTSLGSMRWFRGAGFGLTVATTMVPALDGVPGTVGSFGWGGAASTQFWVDQREGFFALQMTQFLPSGTYPLRPQLRSLVYQALR